MFRIKQIPKISEVCLFLGIALFPLYVFPSGGMQPSHIFMLAFSMLWFCSHGFKMRAWGLVLLFLAAHMALIELLYSIESEYFHGAINFLFLLFNSVIALAVTDYVEKNDLEVVRNGVVVAAIIAVLTSVVSGVNLTELGEGGRETGAFNNPNQLGFFSVCLLSLAYLFYIRKKISYMVAAMLFFFALFLAILSLSKAAIVAILIVLCFALKPKLNGKNLVLWGGGLLIGGWVLVDLYLKGAFDHYLFVNRIQNISQEDDSSLASRGYFIFMDGNVAQLLFGLGQHNILMANNGHEVHSSIASMLNNYGAFGMLLFIGVLFAWMLSINGAFGVMGVFCLTAPYLLYSITHNGTRFTFFWILFASSMAIAKRQVQAYKARSLEFDSGHNPSREPGLELK